jgi:RNA polymerase sigma factor (sigma-70 family)
MEVSAFKPNALAGLRGPTPLLRLQSDERLVVLTRRGNQAAFETLVSRYQSRLLAFCRHMLNSREDAEDVLQEVFAASFNAMVADERPINVRPWLYRIARNRSLNHLRRQTAIGVDSMDVHLADNGLTTADKVHRREEFRQLVGDVQELPETQRTALLLREIDALSYEQIADVMETTIPSVKSLLVRARVSLAEMSEARKLTCDEVRLELGEVAEGLTRMSPPVRRHLKTCDRCATFRQQLKETNKALAAIMPVAPLLFLKKFVLAHLGTTASAGGATAASAAGAAAAASGSAGAASALTAGIGTIASKTAATLAAAAIVTGAAVEVDHATNRVKHPAAPAEQQAKATPPPVAAPAPTPAPAPVQVAAAPPKPAAKPKAQPVTDEQLAGEQAKAAAAAKEAAEQEAAAKEAAEQAKQQEAITPPATTPTGTAQDGAGTTVLPGTVTTGTPTQTVPPPTTTTPPATTTPPPPAVDPAATTPPATEPATTTPTDPTVTTPTDPTPTDPTATTPTTTSTTPATTTPTTTP